MVELRTYQHPCVLKDIPTIRKISNYIFNLNIHYFTTFQQYLDYVH